MCPRAPALQLMANAFTWKQEILQPEKVAISSSRRNQSLPSPELWTLLQDCKNIRVKNKICRDKLQLGKYLSILSKPGEIHLLLIYLIQDGDFKKELLLLVYHEYSNASYCVISSDMKWLDDCSKSKFSLQRKKTHAIPLFRQHTHTHNCLSSSRNWPGQ